MVFIFAVPPLPEIRTPDVPSVERPFRPYPVSIMRRTRTQTETNDDEVILARQALHARRIKLLHPASGEPIEFAAPLPEDLERVLDALRLYAIEG